ncbi:MAG: cadherin-like domain-containing protein [Fibrobacterota bacterium]|nr:cadherin-like domain-containing protein [Fibrobacterota bacterium]QQS05247.1 MAG: cadherin-like domain-containing protein [Fibrobacterota bacterium]
MIRKAMVCLALAFTAGTASSAEPDRVTLPFGQKVFVSGINVAWKGFGGDVGKYPVDTVWFAKMLQGVSDSGGNAVRWWLFTNCSNDPQIDSTTKLVKGIEPNTIANVRKVLDMAYARGISISLCLLSFDMMKTNQTGADVVANKKILQTDEGRKAFIDNAVVPLVKSIGKHPAILNWEIFNEPEGMVKSIAGDWGSIADGIEISHVQKMVNQAAGAIHRAMPGVPVSNGCWAFIAGSNTISGDRNYYSDSALKAVGGDNDGTLDFYMVHYYEWAGTERSPFHHPASYWGLDKPLVIGEFPAKGLSDKVGPMSPAQCWKYLFDNGYAGALGWTYTAHDGFGGLPEAGEGMRALKTLAPAEVTLDFPPSSTDDWYQVNMGKTLSVAAPGVLANDVDPTPGQTLAATLVTDASHGKVTLSANGSFSYTPQGTWTGTDQFTYRALGGAGMADTSTVVLRVLDPAKGIFFAPPMAADWKIYGGWGKLAITDAAGGLGIGNPQWGPTSIWAVGTGVATTISGAEQTVSILVKNDPGSPWASVKFHLAKASSLGSYGPADSATNTVELLAQPGRTDGYVEYRGTLTATAGEYLPSLELIWKDSDGNGPNVDHLSLVRDLEIFPTADFSGRLPVAGTNLTAWEVDGKTLRIHSRGPVSLVVTDLSGRRVASLAGTDELRWTLPVNRGVLVAKIAGIDGSSKVLIAQP